MLFLALTAACVAVDENSSLDSGLAAAARPRHPDPALSVEDVEVALKEAVRFGVPEPFSLVSTYVELLSHGDMSCPGGNYAYGGMEVYDPAGCENGATQYKYEGVCGGGSFVCNDTDGDSLLDLCSMAISGDGHITDPDGNSFLIGGSSLLTATGAPPDGGEYSFELFGMWGYPGADALWLTQESSLGLTGTGAFDDQGITTMSFTGGFTVAGATIDTKDLSFGGACGELPEGTVGLRDDAGYWYDVTFDANSCDGCGELVFDGRHSMGTACVELDEVFRMYREFVGGEILAGYIGNPP